MEPNDVIRRAALAYLHGDDGTDRNHEGWHDFLRELADALGVDHDDVEALG